MPETGLSLTYPDFLPATGYEYGHGRGTSGWSALQRELIDETVHSAYRMVLMTHDWSCLKPTATLKVRLAVTGTLSAIPTRIGSQYILEATAAIFDSTMVGATLPLVVRFDDTGYLFTIVEYISATRVKVLAVDDQPAVTFGEAVTGIATEIQGGSPYTVLTAADSMFRGTSVGDTLNFDNGSSYTIVQFVSATVVHLAGDASAETDTDTIVLERSGASAVSFLGYIPGTDRTAITVPAGSTFNQQMEDDGDSIVFTATGNSYTIVEFSSVQSVRVATDITGIEAVGDTITVTKAGTATDVGSFVAGSQITATEGIFTDDMDDNALVIVFDNTAADGNAYTIVEFVDAFNVIVDADASLESGAFSIVNAAGTMSGVNYDGSQTTITVSAATFVEAMEGMTIRFVRSGNRYTISKFTDTTHVKVLGNAGGELQEADRDNRLWVVGASDIASGSTFSIDNTGGDYDLPDDFGGLVGRITYDPDQVGFDIQVVSDQQILRRRQNTTNFTGKPRYAARQVKPTTGLVDQRFRMLVYPSPDATYTLSYKYRVLAQKMTDDKPYPIGGMMLGETILAACRAVAEERMNNTRGPLWEAYLTRLQGSIAADKRASTPTDAGYATDAARRSRHGHGSHFSDHVFLGGAVTHSGGYHDA